MRVWVDISNSPQVAFFRPLLALLRERGHTVDVSTREYAQTLELLRLHGIEHEAVGPPHAGAGRLGKARALTGRLRALRAYARPRRFDLALSHASHELPLVARSLGIPSAYAFDYEFATAQHGLGCRAATRVVVPDAIPRDRLERLGARAAKVRTYPGFEEEYYLHGFEPDATVLDDSAVTIAGIEVIGTPDPRFTPDKSTGDDAAGEDVLTESGQELADAVGTLDAPPAIALVHDPRQAGPLDGVVPLVLAGHTHKRDVSVLDGGTRLMVEGSTGGAGLRGLQGEEPTPLTCTVLYLDPDTGELQAYDEITIGGLGETEVTIQRTVVPLSGTDPGEATSGDGAADDGGAPASPSG